MPARRLDSRIHCGSAARMGTLNEREAFEWQISQRRLSEDANFECPRGACIAEFITEAQRKYEFRVFARRLNSRIHYGSTAEIRISSVCEALEQQNSLRRLSEIANCECPRGACIAEFITEAQRKCEFRMPEKRQTSVLDQLIPYTSSLV